MPVLTLPDEFLESADLTDIKDALAGMRMDEAMYFLLPNSAVLTAYGGGSKMYDVDKIIQRLRVTILMRFFAQFLLLGTDKVGTQALVQGQEDFFQLALGAIQQDLLEIWQQQLVPLLFRFNRFPGMTGLPQITWQAPGKQDIQALMDAYTKGVGADVITPIRDDEEMVRATLGLPDLPEGVGDGPRGPGAGVEQPAFDGAMGDWGVNH